MLDHRRDKPACTYCMQRHSNATHRATRRQPRQATTLLECATLDRQAHRARPELSPAMTVSRVGTGYLCILPMMYSLALRFVITCARPSLRIRNNYICILYMYIPSQRMRRRVTVLVCVCVCVCVCSHSDSSAYIPRFYAQNEVRRGLC